MTATPIPRTLALTDLRRARRLDDRDLPPGRKPVRRPVQARVAPRRGLRSSCASSSRPGRQAYIIYPLVEESREDRPASRHRDGRPSARRGVSRRTASALLHGRMKPDAKERVMHAFAAGAAAHPGRRRRSSRSASTCRTPRSWWSSTPSASGCRSCTSCAAASAAATWESHCVLLYQPPLDRRRAGAAEGDGRDERRLRDRRARPRAARPRRFLRHAAVGPADAAHRRPGARPRR